MRLSLHPLPFSRGTFLPPFLIAFSGLTDYPDHGSPSRFDMQPNTDTLFLLTGSGVVSGVTSFPLPSHSSDHPDSLP